MKRCQLLGCLAMVALLSACAAPTQRPAKVDSVLEVINQDQPAESSGTRRCPGGTVPVCVSAFRHDPGVCSCGDPIEVRRALDFTH